ncbi:hypothetical protein FALBO_7191 [Fusarium albosuccineum]|uniref:Uncharacterized protein n=1 Tax=Fusarium albosuccineum TaxID=1237068 RepID=A0A8H4P856_9HYPO|nr:hypothetical protein FALBO_7191 [Fusarium albosuccineum]
MTGIKTPKPIGAVDTYPRRLPWSRPATRTRSRHVRTSCVDLQSRRKATFAWLCHNGVVEPVAQNQLEPMAVDGQTGEIKRDPAGKDSGDSLIPEIVIHPPTTDGDVDVDVETICAKIESHLQGNFEAAN